MLIVQGHIWVSFSGCMVLVILKYPLGTPMHNGLDVSLTVQMTSINS